MKLQNSYTMNMSGQQHTDTENRYFFLSSFVCYLSQEPTENYLKYLLTILNLEANFYIEKYELNKGAFTKVRTTN
jgi:hypothetical protein